MQPKSEMKCACVSSCFADEMRRRMQELKFRAEGNFTGPLFNPASVAALLRRAQDPAPATLAELRQDADGWWFHYDANTLLSGPDPAAVLGRYNDALDRLRRLLPAARCLVVTFGTAWVYRLKESGRVVANCHKQPQTLFDRTRLSVEEIAAESKMSPGLANGRSIESGHTMGTWIGFIWKRSIKSGN